METRVSDAEQQAQALLQQAGTLLQQKRYEEARSLLEELVRRYGETPEQSLRLIVASALLELADLLWRWQLPEQALARFEEVLGHSYESFSDRGPWLADYLT
ncbi:MAG TPA: tetratricopeptide repeat protein [Myxococcaceae bacterium]|jgi:tetratricopeptide (TPR) repeat protein